jgi:predicted outer membrane protein
MYSTMMKINANFLIHLTIIITLFTACKSVSYESAVYSNRDRFFGEKEENSLLLVEMKDLSQLVEDLSGLSEEKAFAKDIYDFGFSAVKEHRKFQMQLKILAFKKRVKLPSAVKKVNQDIYRDVHKIGDRKSFDYRYLGEMRKALMLLSEMSDKFLGDGKDTQMRNFITKHSGVFKNEIKRIDTIREYMEKPATEP